MIVTGFCRRLHRTWCIGGSAAFACLTLAVGSAQGQIVQAVKVSETTTSLAFNFDVVNNTAASITKLKVEYFLDPTGDVSAVVPEVDYTTATSLTKSLVTLSPTSQEVVFDFGAQTLAAGAKVTVNARLHLSGYQTMNNANDYSYPGLVSTVAQNTKMRLQVNGTPVFGSAPTVQAKPQSVRILAPSNESTTSLATIDVRWAIDGTVQTTKLTEDLVAGSNKIYRCSADSCATVTVTRQTESAVYEIPDPGPSPLEVATSVSKSGIVLHDRSQIRGANIFAGGAIVGGVSDVLEGVVQAKGALTFSGSVTLRGTYGAGGAVSLGANPVIDGEKLSSVGNLPAIPAVTAAPGGPVPALDTIQGIPPGDYGVVSVPQGAVLALRAGSYSFTALNLYAGARVKILQAGGTDIRTNSLSIGDRTVLDARGGSSSRDLVLRTVQTIDVVVGTDSKMGGAIIAPNAKIALRDRGVWMGTFQASSIDLGSDATLDGRSAISSVLARVGAQLVRKGLENLSIVSNRGTIHISNLMIDAMKRVEVLPLWKDTGYTYLNHSTIKVGVTPITRETLPQMAFLLDEANKWASFEHVALLGSETIGTDDCWKIRIGDFKSPWYLLAYFPEKELMGGSAVAWIRKSSGTLAQLDLTVVDGRPEITFDNMPDATIGSETFRIVPGACAKLPAFPTNVRPTTFRILVQGSGARRAATTLSEVRLLSGGQSVGPLFTGPNSSVTGGQTGLSRGLDDLWRLFDGNTVDDGWSDPSVLGEFWIELKLPNGVLPDQIEVSGPSDPSTGPSGFKLLATADGTTWTTIASDTNLVWRQNEKKVRTVSFDLLPGTCIPSSISITVPGLAQKMDSTTRAFFRSYDFRVPTAEALQIKADADNTILTLPERTDEEKRVKYATFAEYKRMVMNRYLTLHYQVREAIAKGASGVEINEALNRETLASKTYFLSSFDYPKTTP